MPLTLSDTTFHLGPVGEIEGGATLLSRVWSIATGCTGGVEHSAVPTGPPRAALSPMLQAMSFPPSSAPDQRLEREMLAGISTCYGVAPYHVPPRFQG